MKKMPALLVLLVLVVSVTLCASTPAIAEEDYAYEIDPTDLSNEILNDTEQADLIGLVVFAFTIGIIMTILGFAMGIMYTKRG